MDTKYLATGAGVLVPPICGFVANLLLRKKEALKSSGTDWLLVLWVFDLTAALTIEEFSKLIPGGTFRNLGVSLFIVLTFFSLLCWWAIGAFVEPHVRAEVSHWKEKLLQWFLFVVAYSVAMAITAFNTFIFVYKG